MIFVRAYITRDNKYIREEKRRYKYFIKKKIYIYIDITKYNTLYTISDHSYHRGGG